MQCWISFFEKKSNVAFERFQFRQAVQSREESMKSYVTRLVNLGKHCKFEDYSPEDAIIDQVIEHCNSHEIRKKLLSEPEITIDKLISVATLKEDVDQQASVFEKKESVYRMKAHSEDNGSRYVS